LRRSVTLSICSLAFHATFLYTLPQLYYFCMSRKDRVPYLYTVGAILKHISRHIIFIWKIAHFPQLPKIRSASSILPSNFIKLFSVRSMCFSFFIFQYSSIYSLRSGATSPPS
jgi:hypothetical protein